MTIEWGFVALNFVGIFFFLVILTGTIRDYLKTRHETPFWLLFSILMVLIIIRGIESIVYETFGFTAFGEERINITFIVVAICFIWIYALLIKIKGKRFKLANKKPKHKVKEKKAEKKEAQELREGMKIVEEAYKAGVITLENYKKDKAEIMGILEKNEEHEQLKEKVKKIEQFISETEESSDSETEESSDSETEESSEFENE